MSAALAVVFLDQTVVAVALPTLQRELGASSTEVQWVVSAFLLALAALVAAGGGAGDLFGRRAVLLAGLALFGAGSLVAALADDVVVLIAARAVTGAGGALLMPATNAIVAGAYPDERRGRAIGTYLAIATTFLCIGPLVGGLLIELSGWQAIFLVNVPIVAAVAALTLVVVERDERRPGVRLDLVGLALLVAGLAALVLGIMQGRTWGWSSAPTLTMFAVAAVTLGLFVPLELRRTAPIINLRLLRRPSYLGAAAVVVCVRFANVGGLVFAAIYLQQVLDLAPVEAGLALLPTSVPALASAPIAGVLADRFGPRLPVVAGMALVTISLVAIVVLADARSYAALFPALMGFGFGAGAAVTATNAAAMDAVPAADRGEASGVLSTARQVGGAIGLGAMGALVGEHGDRIATGALVDGVGAAFGLAAGVCALGAVAGALLIGRPAGAGHDAAGRAPAPASGAPPRRA